MKTIVTLIISFVFSSFLNVENIYQDENIENENLDVVSNEVIGIQESSLEEILPKKVEVSVSRSTTFTNTSSDWWDYAENIKPCIRDGDDLLVLVNKEYKLPSTYAPSDLVRVGDSVIRKGDSYYLRSILIDDLINLNTAAQADGIDLSIVSAYRSYSTQANTYQYWVNYNSACIECADRISARAGHSQHQLGTTLDFSSSEVNDKLGIKFGDTDASDWLKENAYKYGFVISFPQGYETTTGFSYEPWHYRYIGKGNALEMKNGNMILENFLKSKN